MPHLSPAVQSSPVVQRRKYRCPARCTDHAGRRAASVGWRACSRRTVATFDQQHPRQCRPTSGHRRQLRLLHGWCCGRRSSAAPILADEDSDGLPRNKRRVSQSPRHWTTRILVRILVRIPVRRRHADIRKRVWSAFDRPPPHPPIESATMRKDPGSRQSTAAAVTRGDIDLWLWNHWASPVLWPCARVGLPVRVVPTGYAHRYRTRGWITSPSLCTQRITEFGGTGRVECAVGGGVAYKQPVATKVVSWPLCRAKSLSRCYTSADEAECVAVL